MRYRALLERLPPGEHAHDPAAGEGVAAQLAALPLADRQALVLCVLEGYSERDAVAALGVAPGTVKSRLSRARRRAALVLGGSHEHAP